MSSKPSTILRGKRILVTGGAGSIGSELVRQLAPHNKIFILDTNESGVFEIREEIQAGGFWIHSRTGDVRDKATVFDVFSDFKPQIVFHAAALKHVPLCEEYPEEAVATNVLGTLNVVREARNWECLEKFVFISTDKVVNAKSIMGITKLCAEGIVVRQGARFVAVRFGNVLNSRGSIIPIWQKQMDMGLPLTVTDTRMERYMMSIPDAVALVIKAATDGLGGEVFILDMGKRVNVHDLALSILKEAKQGSVRVTGIRPGEMLSEDLMTQEESARAVKVGDYWKL